MSDAEQALVTKSVKTIVDQVDAMKRLVNDFRDYDATAKRRAQAGRFNSLIVDVMHLYDQEAQNVPVVLDSRLPARWCEVTRNNYGK